MKPQVIVIGASMGGLNALETLLSGFAVLSWPPIAIVQHRGKFGRDMLAKLLQRHTSLTVREAEDKDELLSAHVYIAPADYHLLLDPGYCSLSLEAPVNYARPSVDVLFESAANTFGSGAIGVILTGNNADGACGASYIKRKGGRVIIQNPDDCECDAMARAAIRAVDADYILNLSEIAKCLSHCCEFLEVDCL